MSSAMVQQTPQLASHSSSMTATPFTKDYREIATAKKAEALSKIPTEWLLDASISKRSASSSGSVVDIFRTCGILSSAEIDITENYTAVALAKELATGRLTAVKAAEAFCKRAAIGQQLTNCLTETMFPEALERAKFLDEYLATKGTPIGPLHGLPISIKDSFNFKGVATTLGYISFTKRPLPEENSPLVNILLSLGAVIHVKTNVPQTLMTADSENNLFGRTLNPHNQTLTAGGSSGGEGALVALRGSVIGVGTDIAGSIRIPALCCGDYGFRPSVGRVPYGGQTSSSRPFAPGVKAVAGPLAQNPEDMELFLSAVLGAKPWDYDASALCAPWRQVTLKTSLRIGFILQDERYPISPPITRALKTAVQALIAAGHTVVTLNDFPSFHDATQLCWKFFSTDSRRTAIQNITDGNEPVINSVITASQGFSTEILTMDEYYEANYQRRKLKEQWRKILVDGQFDAVLMPAYTGVAPKHDQYGSPCYTATLNLLDYPASVIPFLTADRSIDKIDAALPDYDPEAAHGMPCSIQLMTRTQHDEELMAVTQVVSDVLKLYLQPAQGE